MSYPPADDRLRHLLAQRINCHVDTWKLAFFIAGALVDDPEIRAELDRMAAAHAAGEPCGDRNCRTCFAASTTAPAAVPVPPPADRAAILRQEADQIRAHCPDHLDSDSAPGAWMVCHCDVADDMLRRVAAEEQPAETQADRGAVLLEIATTLDGLAETDMICKRRSLGTARRLLAGELRKMAAEPSTARPAVGDQPETQEEQHLGGRANAEDCPACKAERRNLPYPFLCPGPDVP
ncbi:hypothetical protein [Streptomyces sp. NPDC057052]|uniref:hypothetical protein n=1 Tax=Streptomyces sp. NPDC057052 TaxID=3346010 RepID=UPI003625B885